MKLLWTIAFSIIFLAHVRSQNISGTWLSDWQNQGLSGCYPNNFTISSEYDPPIITYDFTMDTLGLYCYPQYQPYTGSNIYRESTNEFYDSNSGFNFTYDPNTDSLSAILYETTGTYLFNRNGASIPQETALGTLGAIWTNKTLAQVSESATTCCVPDSIFIALANPQFYLQAQFNAVFYYNTTTCSQTTTYNFQLSTTNPTILSWNSTSNNAIFYNSTEWTFLLSSDNGACNYTYTPLMTDSGLPLGTPGWLRDWQTTPDQYSPWNYDVSYKGDYPNNYYMTSEIIYENGTSYRSFIVQTPEGLYFDPYLNINGTTFSYNSTIDTLLSISTSPATEDALLLSHGNLFSPTGFYSYWTNPVSTNSQALPSDCCVPSYIDIASNASESNGANVIYYFDSNYTSNLGCQDIQQSIDNYQLESTLYIKTPNISQLVWTDEFGNQIYFANSSDTSVIQVSNFAGQCSFNMVMTSTPPPTPTPTPLYSSVVSLGSISLVIGLLLII